MTFTYDPTQLAASDVYRLRLEINDRDEDDPQLQDEEIAHALTVESGFWGAAARCCEIISRDLLRKADLQLGRDLRIQHTTRAAQYAEMAEKLRRKALGAALPYVGGRSIGEKIADSQDSDLVQPLFTKEAGVNPRADEPALFWPPATP